MAKHRHRSQKGGSGNYSSAATYANFVNGSMQEQYARVFDQTETGAVDVILCDDGQLTAGGFLTSPEDRFHLGNGNPPATSSR